jgi:hypothetical protein
MFTETRYLGRMIRTVFLMALVGVLAGLLLANSVEAATRVGPTPPMNSKADSVDYPLNVYVFEHLGADIGIADAPVMVYRADQGALMAKGLTDKWGKFGTGLPTGLYTVYVEAAGYAPFKTLVALTVGTPELKVNLKRPTTSNPPPTPVNTGPGVYPLTIHAIADGGTDVGLTDADVEVHDPVFGTLLAKGLTDKEGKFGVHLPKGVYTVYIVLAGYENFKAQVEVLAAPNYFVAQLTANTAPVPVPTPLNN